MHDPTPLDPADAFDAMTTAAHNHLLLLENDRVRVLDTRLAPGERTPVHAHRWPAALYVMSWSDFIRRDGDGNVLLDSRTMATRPPAGSALWTGPIGAHSVHNIGDAELRILAVEVKPT
jgi:quercetin dioxygenase-like cupin family protein